MHFVFEKLLQLQLEHFKINKTAFFSWFILSVGRWESLYKKLIN